MALTPGTRLGTYDIVAAIGAGGMGEVYRAHDTKLGRDVALKILPESFTHDPDRVVRFRREAQVLGSLNHPNIAAIYGLEEAEGFSALVLELVDGPTLADRIARGPIPLDEALPIAKQIAEALEAAHEQGIIHRDLKSANVKVRPDGMVKVLDFGLAKALDPLTSTPAGVTQSPTLSLAATQGGSTVARGAEVTGADNESIMANDIDQRLSRLESKVEELDRLVNLALRLLALNKPVAALLESYGATDREARAVHELLDDLATRAEKGGIHAPSWGGFEHQLFERFPKIRGDRDFVSQLLDTLKLDRSAYQKLHAYASSHWTEQP